MRDEYEYVVVGSGAGGGPVAANLAEAGHSVLVLEAGGPAEPDDLEYQVPAFHTLASEKDSLSWRFFVRHYADVTRQQRDWKYRPTEGGVFYPRAAGLGGCTAHNAMILACPSNRDWDRIAALTGDDSWRPAQMRRYFQRVEDCRYRPVQKAIHWLFGRNPSRHGFGGWLGSEEADPGLALRDDELRRIVEKTAWLELTGAHWSWARLKAAIKTVLDPNDWRFLQRGDDGVRLTPLATANGTRNGTRERLLAVRDRYQDKLTLRTSALATRVLFDNERRAVGVEYLEGAHLYGADPRHDPAVGGTLRQVTATREVILAGGAFNTPQLLQLSGIGPRELLERHGIDVRVDLPGVGANLQDRYEVSVVCRMKKPFEMLAGALLRPPRPGDEPDPHLRQWQDTRKGIYTTNGAVLSILKRSTPEQPDPDLFLFGLVTNFRGYYPGYSLDVSQARQHLTWAVLKGYTHNHAGRVAIRSSDPREVPNIDFHYFEESGDTSVADLEAVVDAVEFIRRMTSRYGDLVESEEQPGADVQSREQIRKFVKDQAWGHHASCTCKIGRDDDPMAVLDNRFRVRGTRGLRVVDASVFPHIPGLFIVSAVYMVAEKASDVILSDGAAPLEG